VEEEKVETNLASHDVGRLMGEKSPAICHSQGLQVARKHEELQGYRGHAGVKRETSLV
jgi:hypothetical protein